MAATIARSGMRAFRRHLLLAAACVLFGGTGGASFAQAPASDYPNKPIRIVVTFPPGGSADAVLRMLVPRLNESLGQQIIVDNRPGAGGNVGLSLVAKAPADGYTILFTTPGLTINAAFRISLPYDTERDFTPISIVGQVPMLLVSHPSLPVTDYKGFIAYAQIGRAHV